VFLGTPVNQLSFPESLSLEEYEEYGEVESKLYVTRVVSSKYIPVCHTQHGCTKDENVVGQPMFQIAFWPDKCCRGWIFLVNCFYLISLLPNKILSTYGESLWFPIVLHLFYSLSHLIPIYYYYYYYYYYYLVSF